MEIKAIIGLGNPGARFASTRHNIGFRVLDELAKNHNVNFKKSNNMEIAQIQINDKNIYLIKPQTFMNNSGEVVPFLKNKNITAENVLVVHDELELPFGQIKLKLSGSHKGHNGLKSIISYLGNDFYRLKVGISRPSDKNEVPDYVLSNFNRNEQEQIQQIINLALNEIEKLFN